MIAAPRLVCSLLPEVCSQRIPNQTRKVGHSVAVYAALFVLIVATWNPGWAQQPLQVLHNHVHREIPGGQAALVNSMPSDKQLNLSIVLPLRNQAELTSLLHRLYDPSSPDYRHFLSVAQFTEQFGPTAEDYQAVVSFAKVNGFSVTGTQANRLVVPIRGSVAQINQAFNVRMNIYQHPTENRTFFSPDREPSLGLSAQVAHIAGLNNFSIPRPLLVQVHDRQQVANVTGSGPGGSYLGSDMRAAYYGGTTLDGNGQAVGILEFDGYYLSDVNLTFSNAGQSYNVPINNVLLDGATGDPTVFPDDSEQVLDIVQAIGMAPGLSQVRVYIGSNDADILSSMASENIAKQLSCSWGWQPDDPAVADVFFEEFAAQGQSFFTASGDFGAFDAAISPVFYPQEDAYVTAVGGTHLTTNGAGGSWVAETAWNSYSYGSGGGISPDGMVIPSWQTGIASSSNGGSTTLRNVPDVAMEGDFDNYSCAMGSCSEGYAGTSFAAPRWAGFMALINQQAVEAGTVSTGGLGFLNPSLYSIGEGSNYGNDLHDITVGNNDTQNQPVWFNAVAGYDLVTGWGSANGQNLIDDLAGPQVPGFWILGSPSTVSINQGGSSTTTITVTDAGGFSGNVTLAITSALPSGVTASWGTNPTSGSSVLTLTASISAPVSTSTVTITGTSGSLTAATNIVVAVHSPTFALSASPSSLAVNQGASGTSTVSVTPEYGFSGNVNLSVSGLPSGVTATWGTNPTAGSSVLTLAASSSAPGGTSKLTITGTSGSLTVTTTLTLTIQAPSFTFSTGGNVDIGLGGTGNAYIYINPQFGFSGSVNFAVSGLPAGVTGTFSPNPATGYSMLTLTASSSASEGASTLTVTGTSGSLTATTTFTLTIHKPSFTLSGSGSLDIGQGSSGTTYVWVNPQYGFTGSVTLSVVGLPTGVTALWNPNPTSGNSNLTLTASSSAPVGQYTVTITGTSGSLTANTTLSLGVHVPTFTLYSGGSLNIGQGTSNSTYVNVNPQYGFTGSVNLAVSGLPSGVTASFSPNPTTGNSTLTLTAGSSTPVGQYPLTITGTYGSQTATTQLTLGVYVPTFTLYGGSVNIGQGSSGTTWINVNPQYGFTGSVNLTVSGLPSGVTASFSPNPTTSSSMLTLTANSTATVGQYTLTVTGTSGTQTATTTVTLGVYVPTFMLYGPGTVTIGQGTSATAYVNVYPMYGFSGNVSLSASGLPSGVTASFSPNPTTGSSTLTLTASSSGALGQYNVTITGTSGTQTASASFTLGVYVPTFTLSGPGLVSMGQGSTATSYVWVMSQYGFNGNVNLSASGLPTGVTASFSPNPTTGNSTMTLTATSSAPIGQYTVTITGTSGSQTASVTFSLGIYAQSFSLYAYPNGLSMNEGASAQVTVSIAPSYGFNGSVSFSASNLPSGVTASFSPNPATSSSTLNLTASSGATPGTATITITGTSGNITASTTISLTINAPNFTLSDAPSEISLAPGGSENSTILIVPQFGFIGSVNFAVSGLPAGVTASFSPNPATNSSTLTLTAGSTASPGTAMLSISGTSGSLVATAPLALTVKTASSTTATTLTVTSAGNPVTSVASGTAVALTAAVAVGSGNATTGHVNFCESTATYCDDIHRVGSAQLTSAGTAVLKFVPGMGAHSYKAVFEGTNALATSSSAPSSLKVSASTPTTTTIAQSGSPGNYTLTATVTGQGLLSPGGTVSFVDTNNANFVLGTADVKPTATALGLSNTQTPAAGTNPWSVAVGDFNGDGIPDLAVANQSSNNLTILLGKGDGTFTATASNPQTGSYPFFVAVGDFNGDGKADLAVANVNNNDLTILLGNGDGTFAASASSLQTGGGPIAIAVGDFNGDGIQDLAVSNTSTNTITILLGNGDGTFTASPQSPQTGNNPKSIVAGDFNGDGILDLAVTNYWSNTVTILLGNGDGTFVPIATPSTGSYPYALAIGDFNGDGKPDLAVANAGGQTITVLLGNGDGTFSTAATSPQTGSEPIFVAVGDFNGDGISDLAVANEYSSNITMLLGNGDGTFTAGVSPSTGSDQTSIAIGDFNGDGIPDLAVVNYWSNNVTVLTSQLTQTATATASGISPVGSNSHIVEASYPGDSHYASSISTTTTLTGESVTPTVTVTPSASTITTTTPLTVTVAVSGPGGSATPTGSVTLSAGAYASAAVPLTSGSATIGVPAGSLAVSTDTLTVSYTPDSSSSSTYNSSSASTTVTVTQGKVTATVTVTPSSSTITTTTPLTVTVVVSGPGGSATPTGSVTLSAGGYTSAATPLTSGSATINLSAGSLSVGTDTLTVSYAPDSSSSSGYNSSSASVTVTVAKTTPTVTVTPSASSIGTAQSLTVTIAVSGASGSSTPTGSITLSGGGYTSAATPLSNGSATITVSAGSLTVGADTLTATYAGDAVYLGGTATASVTVAASVFTLSASSPPAVNRGSSATSTVTVNSTTGYSGTVVLSCTLNSGGPVNSTTDTPVCTVPSGAIATGGTATATVTTKPSLPAAAARSVLPASKKDLLGGGAVLALLVFLGVPARRRSWRVMLSSLILFATLGMLVACGGGNGNNSGGGKGGTSDPGTASGTYTFTVIGTGTPAVTPSPTITFTVTVN